jgi:hypothetical protein
MKRIYVVAVSVVVFSCAFFVGSPQKTVSNFIEAAQNKSAGAMFMLLEDKNFVGGDIFSNKKYFLDLCNAKAERSKTSWTGEELSVPFYRVFFMPASKFEISSCQIMDNQASVIAKIEYPESGGPLFAREFTYMDGEPHYSGIQPIFQDLYGRGPLGPYSPDDPALTEGFRWHRRLIMPVTSAIESVSIEFMLSKDKKDGWLISKILQPYGEKFNSPEIVNNEFMGHFTLRQNTQSDGKMSIQSKNVDPTPVPGLAAKEEEIVTANDLAETEKRTMAVSFILRLFMQARDFRTANGQWPDLGKLNDMYNMVYEDADQAVLSKWSFKFNIEKDTLVLSAVSKNLMKDGAARMIRFSSASEDIMKAKWSGYGTFNDPDLTE